MLTSRPGWWAQAGPQGSQGVQGAASIIPGPQSVQGTQGTQGAQGVAPPPSHSALSDRSAEDSHPISAITGLQTILDTLNIPALTTLP